MFTDGEEESKEEEAAAMRVLRDKKPERRVFKTAERKEGELGNPVMQRLVEAKKMRRAEIELRG